MKKIYLIDWNSFIYRMFFALPEFSTNSWVIVNALFGIAKLFTGQFTKENPDYLIFIKDAKWKNFRHEIYPDYKATRDRMPDNLRSQIELIEEMILKMNCKIVEVSWYEADDVIWTLATSLWQDENNDIYILSWDKDLYSLTTKNVKIYDTMKGKIYDDIASKNKFEVQSNYITDYLAIVWDNSDNIPWIPWFWPKKAISLINTYWDLENIFNHIEDDDFIISWKTLDKLKESRDIAFLSKKLATIIKNVDLWNFYLEDYRFFKDDLINDEIKDFFKKYEFNSLYKEDKNLKTWQDLNLKVKIIDNNVDLEILLEKIKSYNQIVLDTETTSLDVMQAKLVWISIYLDLENIYYINFWHNWNKVSYQNLKDFLNTLYIIDIEIIWHNLKYDLEIIENFLSSDIKPTSTKKLVTQTWFWF